MPLEAVRRVAEESRNSHFSSPFSIRAIMSSSSTTSSGIRFPTPLPFPHFPQAKDSGHANYPAYPRHHCCMHGVCSVSWVADSAENRCRSEAKTSKKGSKLRKRTRTIFTPSQLELLESTFCRQHYVAGEERRQLACAIKLTETHVKVWFQNRRIRLRKQATEQSTNRGEPTNNS
ncbi:Homeobox protein not2 [Acropora cervicornis]|uniref:Homeobox protein not2 n=1 Tax=Acropora cervicornis TaxID=6130 RepID=A0AAD9V8E6_ACRCE|nr:Homeobox protein not2 [Acropora cervicornis]